VQQPGERFSRSLGPMRLIVLLIAGLALQACASQRLAPGPGPATPQFAGASHWRAGDGYVLAFSAWAPQNPHTIIVALHGMNDYGQFIEAAAKHWQTLGIATYAFDQRGFGRTEGNGRWPGHEIMAGDVRTFVALVRARHPGARVYLLGESMGAAVAMVAAGGGGEGGGESLGADGLILVSPALWGWSNLDLLKRSALWAMMQVAPGAHLTGQGVDIKPSDNQEMLMALGADPYVIKRTRIDAVYGLVGLMEQAWRAAPNVALPTLVLYADGDEVVPAGPIAKASRAMPGVKRVTCFNDGYHMLLRDLKAQRTWREIENFIAGRSEDASAQAGCAEK
jgi:acylglycerol lipase